VEIEQMQDVTHLIRSFALIGLVSLSATIAGCTVVDDDDEDADVEFQADDLDDDEDVDIDIDD
jgi:hypothetical protein